MNLSDKEKQNALNEVRILASIRQPNIIGYKEAFVDEMSNSLWYAYLRINKQAREIDKINILSYC